jgi:hypothetical protein
MSFAAKPVVIVDRKEEASEAFAVVSATALTLVIVVAISYAAIRYLNWAMAPRRFWVRVLCAGVLPTAIVIGLLISLDLSRGVSFIMAFSNLARVPVEGRLLMSAMLLTGLGVSWLTARRRDQREARHREEEVGAFR